MSTSAVTSALPPALEVAVPSPPSPPVPNAPTPPRPPGQDVGVAMAATTGNIVVTGLPGLPGTPGDDFFGGDGTPGVDGSPDAGNDGLSEDITNDDAFDDTDAVATTFTGSSIVAASNGDAINASDGTAKIGTGDAAARGNVSATTLVQEITAGLDGPGSSWPRETPSCSTPGRHWPTRATTTMATSRSTNATL